MLAVSRTSRRGRNAAAALIRNWRPTVLPELVQTADYARVVIPLADVAAKFDHAQQLAGGSTARACPAPPMARRSSS